MRRTGLCLTLTTAAATIAIASAAASAVRVDNIVQVGGRVASFLHPPVSGAVVAGIVFEPGNAASENEARSIERAMGGGMAVGAMRLRPRRISTSALAGLSGARVAFVTKGSNYRAVASAAAPLAVLTISSDPACARAGHCVVSITSEPRVQITVSRAASRASHLKFNSSFLMLVREI